MAGQHRFSAPIEEGRGGGAYVSVPFDVEEVFGRKRVPVRASIDGIPYRGSLVRMGGDGHVLGVLRAIRAKIGKGVGDIVEVVLEEDTAERTVEVPPDLQKAIRSARGAGAAFRALSYSHQREYVRWIGEAKRAETRARRVERTVEMLVRGARPR